MIKKESVTKMCSFYVSDAHLATMLLPYLTKKLQQGNQIYTLLEEDLKPTIEKLLEKLNLEEKLKREISNINWNKKIEYKYSDFEKDLKRNLDLSKETYLMIMGSTNHIKINHANLEQYLEKEDQKNIKIHIIDCYEAIRSQADIEEILGKYEVMINTLGEKKIEEIFKDNKSAK